MATVNMTEKGGNNIPRTVNVNTIKLKWDNRSDGNVVTTADIIQSLSLPAGAKVVRTYVTPIVAFNSSSTAVISVGDGVSSTRYHSSVDIKGSTLNIPIAGTVKCRYASADTVDAIITLGASDCSAGEVDVDIEWINSNAKQPYA